MAIKVNKDNFKVEVLDSELPVMVDFYADWCGPCQALLPIVEEISESNKSVKIVKVNVDESPELAEQYGVMSIPTLLFMKGGEVKSSQVGALPKTAIEEKLMALAA